jgi:4-amino-4-deoxy-L-arabinose transferase-like glycosyltransferase
MEKIEIKIKNWFKENRSEAIILLILLAIGAFLRLYRISEYMTFLGDEGRDVIIVRRLLTRGDFFLIGPGTSIGNMYLGPLYYYMMAPALFLANFSPVGPAVQIALLGVITLFFVWFLGRKWFGKKAALIAALLYAIAPTVIFYSRSSWNPNIMPFFALLCIFSAWKIWQEGNWKWLIMVAVSFAFVLQSHYLGLLLIPTLAIFWLLSIKNDWQDKERRKNAIKYSLISFSFFTLLMSPLFIFDARHEWRNFNSMKKFFLERQTTISARPWTGLPKMIPISEEINTQLLAGHNLEVGKWITFGLIAGIFWLLGFRWRDLKKKQKQAYFLLFTWLFFAVLGLSVYKQEIYDHYYGFFFPAPFLLLGALSQDFLKKMKKIGKFIVAVILIVLVYANLANSPLKYHPNRQLQRSIEVSQKIIEESGNEKFNLAVIAERNYEGAYQYFLERDNAPIVMIDPQKTEETIAEQLFVVCELPEGKCEPVNNPKAEIANFGWSKIEEQWEIAGVILYKLVHAR